MRDGEPKDQKPAMRGNINFVSELISELANHRSKFYFYFIFYIFQSNVEDS